jgi:hypothetical protein
LEVDLADAESLQLAGAGAFNTRSARGPDICLGGRRAVDVERANSLVVADLPTLELRRTALAIAHAAAEAEPELALAAHPAVVARLASVGAVAARDGAVAEAGSAIRLGDALAAEGSGAAGEHVSSAVPRWLGLRRAASTGDQQGGEDGDERSHRFVGGGVGQPVRSTGIVGGLRVQRYLV